MSGSVQVPPSSDEDSGSGSLKAYHKRQPMPTMGMLEMSVRKMKVQALVLISQVWSAHAFQVRREMSLRKPLRTKKTRAKMPMRL